MDNNKFQISYILSKIFNNKKISGKISLEELGRLFHGDGSFAIFMIVFIIPLSIPMPYPPGFATILIIPNLYFAVQLIMGYNKPKLPKWLGKKKIKYKTLHHVVHKIIPYIQKVERLVKPRGQYINIKLTQKIIGKFSLIFCISVALPIPFTNLIPSIGILIMALGLMNHDWLTIFLGIIVGMIGIVVTIIIMLYSHKLINNIFF